MGEHVFHTTQRFVAPKAQDAETELVQYFGALFVVLPLLIVLTAIQFDDQLLLEADKIDDISRDAVLPPKTQT